MKSFYLNMHSLFIIIAAGLSARLFLSDSGFLLNLATVAAMLVSVYIASLYVLKAHRQQDEEWQAKQTPKYPLEPVERSIDEANSFANLAAKYKILLINFEEVQERIQNLDHVLKSNEIMKDQIIDLKNELKISQTKLRSMDMAVVSMAKDSNSTSETHTSA